MKLFSFGLVIGLSLVAIFLLVQPAKAWNNQPPSVCGQPKELGPLHIESEYCAHNHLGHNAMIDSQTNQWVCVSDSGKKTPVDLLAVCKSEFPNATSVKEDIQGDAGTYRCWDDVNACQQPTPTPSCTPTPTGTPSATITPTPSATPSSTTTSSSDTNTGSGGGGNGAPAPAVCTNPYPAPVITGWTLGEKTGELTFSFLEPGIPASQLDGFSIQYGYSPDKLIYGEDNIPNTSTAVTIGSLRPNAHVWAVVSALKGGCAENSSLFDPIVR